MEDGKLEGSSVCLECLVLSYIVGDRSGPKQCSNCFNGNPDNNSDDDDDDDEDGAASLSASDILKGLVLCVNESEKKLFADVCNIAENGKFAGVGKGKSCRIVVEGLRRLGYDASICKSRWMETGTIQAGEHEYEYVDVVVSDNRMLVDVDFQSEFKMAWTSKDYDAVLQSLPVIFIGTIERLQQILAVLENAVLQCLRKNRIVDIPPWRMSQYQRSKWFSPYQRAESCELLLAPDSVIPNQSSLV